MRCMSVKIIKILHCRRKLIIVQNILINILKIQKIKHWQRWPTALKHSFIPGQSTRLATAALETCALAGSTGVRQSRRVCMALYLGQPFQGLMAKIRTLKPIQL